MCHYIAIGTHSVKYKLPQCLAFLTSVSLLALVKNQRCKYTVKKGLPFSRPQPRDVTNESLVSDIPAGDGKIVNLFYSVSNRNP